MFEWTTLFFSDTSSALHVGAYFALFLTSLFLVLYRHPLWTTRTARPRTLRLATLLGGLAIVAFTVTWTLIFQFFDTEAELLRPLSREDWLKSPSTFVKAYEEVTTPTGYCWSSNLLMWVIPGCLFLQTELKRRDLQPLTALLYTATGFMGAISLSFPLFFGHLLLLDDDKKHSGQKNSGKHTATHTHNRASYLQLVCATAAAISVIVLPQTVHTHPVTYVQALMALHTVLAIPSMWDLMLLINPQQATRATRAPRAPRAPRVTPTHTSLLSTLSPLSLRNTYHVLAGASFAVHVTQMVVGLKATNGNVLDLVWSGWQNTCQSSISWDVVFTTLVCSVYVHARRGTAHSLAFVAFAPFLSIGAVWSLFLAKEEGGLGQDNGSNATTNTEQKQKTQNQKKKTAPRSKSRTRTSSK